MSSRRAYKTEIKLNEVQKKHYKQTVGVCRVAYNLFIDVHEARYTLRCKIMKIYKLLIIQLLLNKQFDINFCLFLLLEKIRLSYMSASEFYTWFSTYYANTHTWVKKVDSKALRNVIDNADKAYRKFKSGESGYPVKKHRDRNNCNYYFVRNSLRYKDIIKCERHRIKIQGQGWIQLMEFGYLPKSPEWNLQPEDSVKHISSGLITSGSISKKANRHFISVVTNEILVYPPTRRGDGNNVLGIDVGVKTYCQFSNGNKVETRLYEELQEKRHKAERKMAKKYECAKKTAKTNKTEIVRTKQFDKQVVKVAQLHLTESFQREDHINKAVDCVIDICNGKETIFDGTNTYINSTPDIIYNSVVMEKLDIQNMLKDKSRAKANSEQGWYKFRTKLIHKCKLNGIEVRLADTYFPSSKLCSKCGYKDKDLKLSARTYICPNCGFVLDRDLNASINLRDLKDYIIA